MNNTISKEKKRVRIFDLDFFAGTKKEFVEVLTEKMNSSQLSPIIVYTPNTEQVVLTKSDPGFKEILQRGEYRIPDGMGIVTASRLLSFFTRQAPLPERIAGTDVVETLIKLNSKHKILLIGGREYESKLPANITWTEGYCDVSKPTDEEEHRLEQLIRKTRPQIVFVAFGAPVQERFIYKHFDVLLNNKVALVMVVGGAFDFLLGKVQRAPQWMQRSGFEWLFRLVQEPWRWKRQIRIIQFQWILLQEMWRSLLTRFFLAGVHSE